MELSQLRALLAVAEAGSLKAGSARLDLPRGTVRRRIDALEASLGVELLHRDGRGAVLTDAGHAVVARGRRLIEDADRLRAAATGSHEPTGTVHVCSHVGMPPEVHVMLARLFRETLADVCVRMHLSESPVNESLTDMDVLFHFGPVDLGTEWIQIPYAEVRERLLASKAYLAQNGTPKCIEDLKDHRLLGFRAPERRGDRWFTTGGKTLPFRINYTTPSVFLLFHQIAGGNGIGLVPDGNAPTVGVDMNDLVEVLPGQVGGTHTFCVSVRRALEEHAGVRAVLQHGLEYARAMGIAID